MKRSMLTYMKNLSRDTDGLEQIIEHKYRKFIGFYWLVNKYSDKIDDMTYQPSKNDSLHVTLVVKNKRDLKYILSELNNDELDDNIEISSKGNKINIILTQDEEMQP